MQTNLRRTLDIAIGVDKLLRIKLKVLADILVKENQLADEMVVLLAEICNATNVELDELHKLVEGIAQDIKIFGEQGVEKSLRVQEDDQ